MPVGHTHVDETLAGRVRAGRSRLRSPDLRGYLRASPTPLVQHPAFAQALGVDAWLKLETAQPTGAFKVRGGINWMSVHAPDVRERGVVTASTGNHGQSIAYAARAFGVPAFIFAPEGSNAFKVRAMEAMGAQVRLEGHDFGASVAAARAAAQREGRTFLSSGDEPLLIAGVGSAALEAFAARTFDAMRGIGTLHVAYDAQSTLAEGLAVRESYDMPQAILAEHLSDFVLVEDSALISAMRFLIEHAHQLAEPAAVAGLAYLLAHRDEFKGQRVLLPITGGNIAYSDLVRYLGVPGTA